MKIASNGHESTTWATNQQIMSHFLTELETFGIFKM
jgi:hypothetical protein